MQIFYYFCGDFQYYYGKSVQIAGQTYKKFAV